MQVGYVFGAGDLKPAIVAHRGLCQTAPENSLAAIEAAIDAGFDGVTIDIQKSGDGVFFLMHDTMLTRMTGTEFPCQQMSIARLQAMPLKQGRGGSGSGFSHHVIPTLAEALQMAKGRIWLGLDVRQSEDLPQIARLIARMEMQRETAIKLTVHTETDAQFLLALAEEYDLTAVAKTRFDAQSCTMMIERLKAVGATLVEARFDSLYTLVSHRADFEQAGITLWVNSLDNMACCGFSDKAALADPDAIWGSLTEAGIAAIESDAYEALLHWRQAHLHAVARFGTEDAPPLLL